MAVLSSLDSASLEQLRARLLEVEGVEAVWFDDPAGVICLACEPVAEPAIVQKQTRDIIANAGIGDSVRVETVVRAAGVGRIRVRFVEAQRRVESDRSVTISVKLEWQGKSVSAEARNESGDLIEMRTAAIAAVSALEQLIGEPLDVKIVGIKPVRAFDSDLVVVSMYRTGDDAPQRLIGAVPLGPDHPRAAAVAVLNGLNRILGNFLTVA